MTSVPREPKYLYLTGSMLVSVVLITSASPTSRLSLLGVLISALTLLATAYQVRTRGRQWLLAALFGTLALLPLIGFSIYQEPVFPVLASRIYPAMLGLWLLFTLYVTVMVFRGIVNAPRIHANEVLGAIYAYLLIGVLFAQVYQLTLAADPGALYFDPNRFPEPTPIGTALRARGAGDVLYYSFITLGTVGFGDVTPSSPLARALSLIEAMTGILYVATMIARFVAIQIGDGDRNPT